MNTILETETIQIIKEEIESRGLTALKIILFGSRARATSKKIATGTFL